MAAEQVVQVRLNIAEPDETGGWTDARIQSVLDAYDQDVNASSGYIWSVKAAETATLVDISENGSSRKMSDVHKNALAMTTYYRGLVAEAVVIDTGRPRTRAIVRP